MLLRSQMPLFWLAVPLLGGPVEFGREELRRALGERGFAPMALKTEIVPGPAEAYTIAPPDRITGCDARGPMYGLLDAAAQIRQHGRLAAAGGTPAVAMRGVRHFLYNLEAGPSQAVFTIPAEHISPKWDLMYYFEALNDQGSGWFQPDPLVATPYYVVEVR